MIKLALICLLIALLAGAAGLSGVSAFALDVSQFLFSVVGLFILVAILLSVYFWKKWTAGT